MFRVIATFIASKTHHSNSKVFVAHNTSSPHQLPSIQHVQSCPGPPDESFLSTPQHPLMLPKLSHFENGCDVIVLCQVGLKRARCSQVAGKYAHDYKKGRLKCSRTCTDVLCHHVHSQSGINCNSNRSVLSHFLKVSKKTPLITSSIHSPILSPRHLLPYPACPVLFHLLKVSIAYHS